MNREIIDWERKGNLVRFYLGKNGEQWGDDWDDVPWEHNAGRVYDKYIEGYKTIAFPFEYNIYEPRRSCSKRDLINRIVPCLVASKRYFTNFQDAWEDEDAMKFYFGDKIHVEQGVVIEEMADPEVAASELGLDINYKTFRKGNHKYLELNDFISGLIVQYHLAIQKKIISALSDYQLKRLIEICTYELQQRGNEKE